MEGFNIVPSGNNIYLSDALKDFYGRFNSLKRDYGAKVGQFIIVSDNRFMDGLKKTVFVAMDYSTSERVYGFKAVLIYFS